MSTWASRLDKKELEAKVDALEMKLKVALTEIEVLKRVIVEKDELIDDYRAEAWDARGQMRG
jgi:regulator of replication initiation timing